MSTTPRSYSRRQALADLIRDPNSDDAKTIVRNYVIAYFLKHTPVWDRVTYGPQAHLRDRVDKITVTPADQFPTNAPVFVMTQGRQQNCFFQQTRKSAHPPGFDLMRDPDRRALAGSDMSFFGQCAIRGKDAPLEETLRAASMDPQNAMVVYVGDPLEVVVQEMVKDSLRSDDSLANFTTIIPVYETVQKALQDAGIQPKNIIEFAHKDKWNADWPSDPSGIPNVQRPPEHGYVIDVSDPSLLTRMKAATQQFMEEINRDAPQGQMADRVKTRRRGGGGTGPGLPS